MRSKRRAGLTIGVLGAVLVGSVLLATALGAVRVDLLGIVEMMLNKLGIAHFQPFWRSTDETIVFQIRLPRVLGAALVGSALGTAGVLFQGLLRNPMADPYIIGTSAGAALGAAIAMTANDARPFLIVALGDTQVAAELVTFAVERNRLH